MSNNKLASIFRFTLFKNYKSILASTPNNPRTHSISQPNKFFIITNFKKPILKLSGVKPQTFKNFLFSIDKRQFLLLQIAATDCLLMLHLFVFVLTSLFWLGDNHLEFLVSKSYLSGCCLVSKSRCRLL